MEKKQPVSLLLGHVEQRRRARENAVWAKGNSDEGNANVAGDGAGGSQAVAFLGFLIPSTARMQRWEGSALFAWLVGMPGYVPVAGAIKNENM